MKMRDFGWVWEGQGIDPGVYPSVFGVGDGAEFFGLSRALLIFHPNDPLSLSRLARMDEVICDITK